jgi:rubrerythrin
MARATISLEQALRNAIEAEDASARYYTLLAESAGDEGSRALLEEMAHDETMHKDQIGKLAREMTDRPLPNIPDDSCELVETRAEWAHAEKIDRNDALRIAIEAEEFAALYYDAIASTFEPGATQKLFETLARTEEQHAKRLRAIKK